MDSDLVFGFSFLAGAPVAAVCLLEIGDHFEPGFVLATILAPSSVASGDSNNASALASVSSASPRNLIRSGPPYRCFDSNAKVRAPTRMRAIKSEAISF